MRVASYNQMFGCNGRSMSEFLYVHALHRFKLYKTLEKRVDLNRTIKTIKESNADIIGIAEILGERQREMLTSLLKESGYAYFHIGRGHGLGQQYGGAVETMIATRIPSETVFSPTFSVPDKLRYGGGIVGIYVPIHNLYVVQLHLPLSNSERKSVFENQVASVLQEVVRVRKKDANSKIILMGDFNSGYDDLIHKFPAFLDFHRLSPDTPTCPTTNLLRWFYKKDLDHIFGIGIKAQFAGVLQGISDHRLVWVDLCY